MTTLTSDLLISEITDEVSGLPYVQRMAVVRAYEQILEEHEDEAVKLRYAWPPDLGPSHSPDRADALVHAITDLILDRNPIMIW